MEEASISTLTIGEALGELPQESAIAQPVAAQATGEKDKSGAPWDPAIHESPPRQTT